jgi:hypothetical protein
VKKKILLLGIIASLIAPSLMLSNSVVYADAKDQIQKGIGVTGAGSSGSPKLETIIASIIQTMFFIIGVLAVIVIIYSGFLFIVASGNPQTIQKAKTSIVYAVVGLVVAIMAYAIVGFVVNTFQGDSGGGSGSNSSAPASENSGTRQG